MKRKDLAVVVMVIIVSAVISFFISNAIFSSPKNRQQQVEVVQPISGSLPTIDKRFFNSSSIDPTQLITVGENANPNPFSTPDQ